MVQFLKVPAIERILKNKYVLISNTRAFNALFFNEMMTIYLYFAITLSFVTFQNASQEDMGITVTRLAAIV